MRHRKHTFKIGRTSSHRRCLIANMLKSLIEHGKIETSITKAKELRRHADRMITLAKKDTLASRRQAISKLMICYNPLESKEARAVKQNGDQKAYNGDRRVIYKLFELGKRFSDRQGGYTRITKVGHQVGDNSLACVIEYLND
jgi:large subunit ribosomal protein L17